MTRRFDKAPGVVEGLAVDRDAEVPIGVQLGWALRLRISDGTLARGQRIPALRDLARETGVNVNTVRAVYQRLEGEGLIESRQGEGTFVTGSPRHAESAGKLAAEAARRARESGVDPRAVAGALYVSADEEAVVEDRQRRVVTEADRRRLLRRQIAALERTLVEIEQEHPGVAPRARGRRGIGPAVLDAGELEQVRSSLLARLATVQAAIDEHLAEERRGDAAAQAGKARSRKPAARAGAPAGGEARSRPLRGARAAPAGT